MSIGTLVPQSLHITPGKSEILGAGAAEGFDADCWRAGAGVEDEDEEANDAEAEAVAEDKNRIANAAIVVQC